MPNAHPIVLSPTLSPRSSSAFTESYMRTAHGGRFYEKNGGLPSQQQGIEDRWVGVCNCLLIFPTVFH